MSDTVNAEARISHIFSASLNLDVPSVEMDLFETGTVDSLAFVEFLLRLEQEFGIKVALEDLEIDRFRTIRRIAQFVVSRNVQGSAAG